MACNESQDFLKVLSDNAPPQPLPIKSGRGKKNPRDLEHWKCSKSLELSFSPRDGFASNSSIDFKKILQ